MEVTYMQRCRWWQRIFGRTDTKY